jgi:sterol desaturase/sphingolipid hydroxylase (fatty acid hydroxylase superfamily)
MTGAPKSRRWFANLSLVLISSAVMRVVFPAAAVGAALWAEVHDWGLFRQITMSAWIAGVLSFVLLDFAVWLEHVASHKVPLLWRIHRMHHADNGFDVTTGLRFHPLEILLSMLWKALIVILLGAPVAAVLVFEIVLNGTSMFNHSNIAIPARIDRMLRFMLVTPDMHRVHHSSIRGETDSNYGFNFPFWDRLFSTYTAQPSRGHGEMEIGLSSYRGTHTAGLLFALGLPFRRDKRRTLNKS